MFEEIYIGLLRRKFFHLLALPYVTAATFSSIYTDILIKKVRRTLKWFTAFRFYTKRSNSIQNIFGSITITRRIMNVKMHEREKAGIPYFLYPLYMIFDIFNASIYKKATLPKSKVSVKNKWSH